MKIHAQPGQPPLNQRYTMIVGELPGFPPMPSMFAMAAANRPPLEGVDVRTDFSPCNIGHVLNAPAMVTEEKNTATLEPISERLYQLRFAS
jgi:hypothetical protein